MDLEKENKIMAKMKSRLPMKLKPLIKLKWYVYFCVCVCVNCVEMAYLFMGCLVHLKWKISTVSICLVTHNNYCTNMYHARCEPTTCLTNLILIYSVDITRRYLVERVRITSCHRDMNTWCFAQVKWLYT